MSMIEDFLVGEIDIPTFLHAVEESPAVQEELNSLIPAEAKGHPAHEMWRRISYDTFHACGYDVLSVMERYCRFDGSIGDNLNIFGTVHRLYLFLHPDFRATDRYRKAHGIYLSAVQDCFDGPEVHGLVEQIVEAALEKGSQTAQLQEAKRLIRLQFHVEGRQRPYWIQGPEWPMGTDSPMRYLGRKKQEESVVYCFQDAATGMQRNVVQHY